IARHQVEVAGSAASQQQPQGEAAAGQQQNRGHGDPDPLLRLLPLPGTSPWLRPVDVETVLLVASGGTARADDFGSALAGGRWCCVTGNGLYFTADSTLDALAHGLLGCRQLLPAGISESDTHVCFSPDEPRRGRLAL